jgi:glycosyltransferase involved in cell wall biosynthesis
MHISIVIPTLNEEAMLPRLLNSITQLVIAENTSVEELIVVDAGSSDGTVAIAEESGCLVIKTAPGNVSRSRNLGAARAKGNVVAFVDADCELSEQWLLRIVEQLRDDDVIAAGAALAVNSDNPSWVERTWFELAHRNRGSQASRDVDWLPTFNLAVKKEAFAKVGGFDEELPTCEDVEIGYRLSSLGSLRKIEANGVIHHGESKTVTTFFRREAWRSRGAVGLLAKYWRKPRELFGFFLPFIVMGSLATSLVAQIYGVMLYSQGRYEMNWINLLMLVSGPLALLVVIFKRNVKWSCLVPGAALLCVYFTARCVGSLRPFGRVGRTVEF